MFFMLPLQAQNIQVAPSGAIALSVQKARIQGQEFTPINLFTASDHLVEREKHAGVLAQATYVTLVESSLESLVKNKPEAIQLSVPYFGRTLMMDLVRVEVLSSDFQAFTSESGDHPVDYVPGVFYRGIVDGDAQSIVALSFSRMTLSA
jgi:hypothetical protein